MTRKFKLSMQNWIKALMLAFFGALLPIVSGWFQAGQFPTDWETWRTAIFTSLVPVLYLVISWLQNSDGSIVKPEKNKDA